MVCVLSFDGPVLYFLYVCVLNIGQRMVISVTSLTVVLWYCVLLSFW